MSELLLGRYELLELIGEGAMGAVYRAHDTTLDRVVALKVMNASLGASPELVARFEREARSLAGLQHPNIVTIYDFLKPSGNLCLVMELVAGEPLDKAIKMGLALTVQQKLAFMAQACRALQYAHEKGIIHRDLKPSNILMLPDCSPKIIDFGIAKLMDSKLTRTNTRIGTIAYSSPEQLNGDRVDHRTDIFAAGVVLYEFLAGICPFEGAHTTATMKKILIDPTPILPENIVGVPLQIRAVLERALAKDPDQRFQTAAELAQAIERTGQSVPIGGPSGGQLQKMATDRGSSPQVPAMTPSISTAEPSVSEPPGYRLFNSNAVLGGTILGGPIAAASLMAINYWRMGQKRNTLVTAISGLLVTGLVAWVDFLIPKGIAFPVAFGLAFAAKRTAEALQGQAVKDHADREGRLGSGWAAAGIGLAGAAMSILVIVGWFAYTSYAEDGPSIQFGSKDKIYYSGSASKENAQSLGDELKTIGYLSDKGVAVFLAKDQSGTTVSFVVRDGFWDEPGAMSNFEEIGRDIAPSVGGYPIHIRLLNSQKQVEKESVIGRVVVGTKDLIYYYGTATEADGQALGKALQAEGFFTDQGLSEFVSKDNPTTTISFVVKDGYWDDSAHVAGFEDLVRKTANSIGGLPIQLRLVNSTLEVKKEVTVN